MLILRGEWGVKRVGNKNGRVLNTRQKENGSTGPWIPRGEKNRDEITQGKPERSCPRVGDWEGRSDLSKLASEGDGNAVSGRRPRKIHPYGAN